MGKLLLIGIAGLICMAAFVRSVLIPVQTTRSM